MDTGTAQRLLNLPAQNLRRLFSPPRRNRTPSHPDDMAPDGRNGSLRDDVPSHGRVPVPPRPYILGARTTNTRKVLAAAGHPHHDHRSDGDQHKRGLHLRHAPMVHRPIHEPAAGNQDRGRRDTWSGRNVRQNFSLKQVLYARVKADVGDCIAGARLRLYGRFIYRLYSMVKTSCVRQYLRYTTATRQTNLGMRR